MADTVICSLTIIPNILLLVVVFKDSHPHLLVPWLVAILVSAISTFVRDLYLGVNAIITESLEHDGKVMIVLAVIGYCMYNTSLQVTIANAIINQIYLSVVFQLKYSDLYLLVGCRLQLLRQTKKESPADACTILVVDSKGTQKLDANYLLCNSLPLRFVQ